MSDELNDALASAREWLSYAEGDLEVCRRTLEEPPLTSAAFFHAQQAAEKALKAYWAYLSEDRIPRTHDLVALAEGIAERGGAAAPADDIGRLVAYSVGIRYPEVAAPTAQEAHEAMAAAEAILQFIRELIIPHE